MEGSGTQNNPYIIMTAADLYSMSRNGSNSTYFKLGADIDLNGTPYAENFESITLKCAGFDGGGHCIRNIVNQSSEKHPYIFTVIPRSGGSAIEVKNLRLENVQLTGEYMYVFCQTMGTATGVHLYNCVFLLNIKRYGNVPASTPKRCYMCNEYISKLEAELCTICFEGESEVPYAFFSGASITRCHIHLDVHIDAASSENYGDNGVIARSTVNDSYITGRIVYGNNVPDGYRHLVSGNSSFYNSYFALSVENAQTLHWNANFVTTCFYDSDLIPDTVHIYDSSEEQMEKLHALTTAQCKNAEYLTSIGFLCVGDEV